METRRIGPLDVTVATRGQAIDFVLDVVARGAPKVVGFANAHTVDVVRREPALAKDFADITMFNDGVAIDLWSKMVWGEKFPENLNGTDLNTEFCAALPAGAKLFLVGDKLPVVTKAAAVLAERFPHLTIAGFRDGFFDRAAELMLAEAIKQSGADLVITGMGQPRQELWALRTAPLCGKPILCVGAWLGFTAGEIARAPKLLRSLRLEWMFRLAREPRRLASRYITGSARLAGGILEQKRKGSGSGGGT